MDYYRPKKSICIKSKLYRKSLREPSIINRRKYTEYRNNLTTSLRTADENYYQDLVNTEKSNMKHMFGSIVNPQKIKENNDIQRITSTQVAADRGTLRIWRWVSLPEGGQKIWLQWQLADTAWLACVRVVATRSATERQARHQHNPTLFSEATRI